MQSGGLRCWGDNKSGQLGDGTTTNRPSPPQQDTLGDVAAIATGAEHTCVIRSGGGVRCWGANVLGELGDGGNAPRSTPPDTDVLTGARAIAAGTSHTCAVAGHGRAALLGQQRRRRAGRRQQEHRRDAHARGAVAGGGSDRRLLAYLCPDGDGHPELFRTQRLRPARRRHDDGPGAARHHQRLSLTAKRCMAESKPGLFDRAQRAEQRGNRDIRDLWQRYQGHRQQVTAAILALAPPDGGRLLPAGRGQRQRSGSGAAGRSASTRCTWWTSIPPRWRAPPAARPPAVRAKLRSHAPVDVSGLYQQLARWDGSPAPLPTVQALVDAGAAAVLGQLPAGVRRGGLLLRAQPDVVGAGAAAVTGRRRRWRCCSRRCCGSTCARCWRWSSRRAPPCWWPIRCRPLPIRWTICCPDEDLAALAARLASTRVTYPVCNPELVRQMLRRDPQLASRGAAARAGRPVAVGRAEGADLPGAADGAPPPVAATHHSFSSDSMTALEAKPGHMCPPGCGQYVAGAAQPSYSSQGEAAAGLRVI